MGLNAEFIDLSPAVESPRQGQGVSCRFRGVLRDIGRDPQVAPVIDQISDIELPAPANGLTSETDQFEFRNDLKKFGMEKVDIDPRWRVGESCLRTIYPQDQVKVNETSALVLRHLDVADFEHLAKFRHRETSIRCETVTGLFNRPIPQT
jgi:hypothetical protein